MCYKDNMCYDYEIFNEIFDICEQYNFEYLDEYIDKDNEPYIKIEFIGSFKSYVREDFDNRFDYYRTTEKIVNENIQPWFDKCWNTIKDYNIFENWDWDYEDYPCYYLNLKKDIAEKVLNGELKKI